MSALIGLEKGRDTARGAARLQGPFKALLDLLEGEEDRELTRVFATWITQVVRLPERLPAEALGPLEQLRETYTMLEETVQGWIEEGRVEGIELGIEQGRHEERALLCRLAARKFGDDTSERLAAALAGVTDPDRLALVGDWIIECATAAELIARVVDEGRPGDR